MAEKINTCYYMLFTTSTLIFKKYVFSKMYKFTKHLFAICNYILKYGSREEHYVGLNYKWFDKIWQIFAKDYILILTNVKTRQNIKGFILK
jgi:hypothetical protein